MENALFIAKVLGPVFLVFGLSILLYLGQWVKVMNDFVKNHFMLLPMSIMGMVVGLLVINTYNVWAWDKYVIVTVAGWAAFLKSVFYLLAPGEWTVCLMKSVQNKTFLAVWGVIAAGIGAWLSYSVYMV